MGSEMCIRDRYRNVPWRDGVLLDVINERPLAQYDQRVRDKRVVDGLPRSWRACRSTKTTTLRYQTWFHIFLYLVNDNKMITTYDGE